MKLKSQTSTFHACDIFVIYDKIPWSFETEEVWSVCMY